MTEGRCDLASKKCSACTKDTPKLDATRRKALLTQVPKWKFGASRGEIDTWIYREFAFKNFAEAVGFITLAAVVAEEENHHPDFELYQYRFVNFRLKTHAIKGLSENDFIVAAKLDEIFGGLTDDQVRP